MSAPPSRTPSLPPGRRLGAYEVLDQLGAGGMGEVYRARGAISRQARPAWCRGDRAGVAGISSFAITPDGRTCAYNLERQLGVLYVGEGLR